nr:MAG TPA: hypothetical protein [Caudoviricetes sp.]
METYFCLIVKFTEVPLLKILRKYNTIKLT